MKCKNALLMGMFAVPLFGSAITASAASPALSLFQTGTASSSVSYALGQVPTSFTLDLHLNTGGSAVDGLEFYVAVTSTPSVTPTYAGPMTIGSGQGPFTAADEETSISAGAPVNSTTDIALFEQASGKDFPASSDYDVLSLPISTATLGVGTYTFSPVGEAFTDSPNNSFTSTFATPSAFSFKITPAVPEPATASILAIGVAVAATRRQRNA